MKESKTKNYWKGGFLLLLAMMLFGLAGATTTITDTSINNVVYVSAGDASDLQNKVAACDGCILIIPDGTYSITDSLTFNGKDGVVLGSGDGTIIKPVTSDSGFRGAFHIKNGADVTIRDLTLDGTDVNDSLTHGHGVNILTNGGAKVTIENLYIHDFPVDGVYIRSRGDFDVVQNNFITGSGRHGITIVRGSHKRVLNNHVINVAQTCVQLENVAGEEVTDIQIIGNTLSNCTNNGIVTSEEGMKQDWLINSNIINNTGTYGIYLYNFTSGAVVTNNQIYNAGSRGIQYSGVSNGLIGGNQIISSGDTGLLVRNIAGGADSDNVSIIDNIVRNSVGGGISVYGGDNSIISNNRVFNSGGIGMYVNQLRALVNSNSVSNSGNSTTLQPGIVIDSDKTIVNNNNVYDDQAVKTQSYGLQMKSSAAYCTVLGNVLLDNNNGSTDLQTCGTTKLILGNNGVDNVVTQLDVDVNNDATGLVIDSAATTDSNYALSAQTGSGAWAARIGMNNNQAYLGIPANTASRGSHWFFRNLGSADTASPLVFIEQDNAGDDQDSTRIQQDGTGLHISLTGTGATCGAGDYGIFRNATSIYVCENGVATDLSP